MTELHTLIINRILLDGGVLLSDLEAKAESRGVSLQDLYTAIDKVHKDKRIKRGVKGGEIHYSPTPPPKSPTDHLKWVRENYPRYEYEMPFPEIDMSYMFLKTREERDAFMAEMKGGPVRYNKKKYVNTRR